MIDEGLKAMNNSFLRGHVAQLAQRISQLSLKPGEEEIKKRMVAILEMIYMDIYQTSFTLLP